MRTQKFTPLALAVLVACSKHSDDAQPAEAPIPQAMLTISQPTAGGTYHNGDTVWFIGRAISTENIHGYDVAVKKAADSTNLYYEHIHDHNDTINIKAFWVNDRATPQDMEAFVILYLDHDGHLQKKTIPFKVQ